MIKRETFASRVLEYNKWLSHMAIDLPDNYSIINQFNGENKEKIEDITDIFYNKYYNDNHKRRLILGSSPARRGTSQTGIPFEDASHLYQATGIIIENFYINKSSSDFLHDVIEQYGGCQKFYQDFFMNFVCPLGIVNINAKGNEVNANYYEKKNLEKTLQDFIIESLKRQISLGINTSFCYCIGSGENFKFLEKINAEYHFFDKIIPLEHPRFIIQYNSCNKKLYLEKYIAKLSEKN